MRISYYIHPKKILRVSLIKLLLPFQNIYRFSNKYEHMYFGTEGVSKF